MINHPKNVRPSQVNRDLVVALGTEVEAGRMTPEQAFARIADDAGRYFDANSDAPLHEARVREAEEKALRAKSRLQEFLQALKATPARILVHAEGKPWTRWDQTLAIVLGAFSTLFLIVTLNTIATTTLAGGSINSAMRAYLYAATPLAVALVVKCAADNFTGKERHRYIGAVQALGILCGLLWCIVFALAFPGIGAPATAFDANGLWEGGASGGANQLLTACQLLAETLLAAGAFLQIQRLVDKHEVSTSKENPEAAPLQSAVVAAEAACDAASDDLGGHATALAQEGAKRDVFVQENVSALKLRLDHIQPASLLGRRGTIDPIQTNNTITN